MMTMCGHRFDKGLVWLVLQCTITVGQLKIVTRKINIYTCRLWGMQSSTVTSTRCGSPLKGHMRSCDLEERITETTENSKSDLKLSQGYFSCMPWLWSLKMCNVCYRLNSILLLSMWNFWGTVEYDIILISSVQRNDLIVVWSVKWPP